MKWHGPAIASAFGAAVGLVGALITHRGLSATLIIVACGTLLGAIAAIDVRERRIPNALTYPGLIVAWAVAALAGREAFLVALLGAALAGLVMGIFYVVGRGRLGLGDVKLSILAGALVGWSGVPLFLLLGTSLGAVGALVLLARGHPRTSTFAYGPYLAAAAAIVLVIRGPLLR